MEERTARGTIDSLLSPETNQQERYREKIFATPAPPLELPYDKIGGRADAFHTATVGSLLPRPIKKQLEELATAEGASLYTVMAATLLVLAHRYTRQDDVCIGITVDEWPRHQLGNPPGAFSGVLPLRLDLGDNPIFRELLRQVDEQVAGVFNQQPVSVEDIFDRLHPQWRSTSGPLFDVIFSFHSSPEESTSHLKMVNFGQPRASNGVVATDEEGTTLVRSDVKPGSGCALHLNVIDGPEALEVWLEYRTELFDEGTIRRLLCNFEVLLKGATHQPDATIYQLPLLHEAERRKLVYEWNSREREYPRHLSLVAQFEAQADATPHQLAVIGDDARLTYCELEEAANRLARYLVSAGTQKGEIVALCLDRSVDMIVSILAVMKAGAGYLPLDPLYPQDRLRFMLEDAGVKLMLMHERHREILPAGAWREVALQEIEKELAGTTGQRLNLTISGDDVCYVMYTSGSTGKPKGAILEHRGVANCVIWMQDEFALNPEDRVLFKENYCLDGTVWEMFWPLLAGAAIVVVAADRHLDAGYLSNLIRRERVSVIYFVASLLKFFLEDKRFRECQTLRHVFCGGEALSRETMRRYYSLSAAPLHNWYGPTEASIGTVNWTCNPAYERPALPIGKPINNVRAYVVDKYDQLVPIGVPGELILAGISVGRGYLNRPELTEKKFGRDPFRDEESWEDVDRRTYRTGDLTRYLPDGNIEFLGRIDDQIKIRGQRIEVGEIQAIIEENPHVKEAYVLAKDSPEGDKRLLGYVVLNEAGATDPKAIRQHARRKLPEYMIPEILILDAIPHMPNGKVDRRALPEPDASQAGASELLVTESFVAPRTPTEEALAAIWAELLQLPRVGIDDRFFDLNGNSLLAMGMLALIYEKLGISLPVSALYRASTVRELAVIVESTANENGN